MDIQSAALQLIASTPYPIREPPTGMPHFKAADPLDAS
jgi:hypothetical protein